MKKIIFFCEGIALSHLVRPLALAGMLDTEAYTCFIAASKAFQSMAGDNYIQLPSISAKEFNKKSNEKMGKNLYTSKVLEFYVKAEVKIIQNIKPDLVVGDMRISLGISSKLCNVQYISILNAYWSPYGRIQMSMPEIASLKHLSKNMKARLLSKMMPVMNENMISGYNTLCRKNGMETIHFVGEMYANGDYNMYVDVPSLFEMNDIPQNHMFIGPLIDFMDSTLPKKIKHINYQKKVVYCSLGSTGDKKKLKKLAAVLEKMDVTVIFVTAGRMGRKELPKTFHVFDFLPVTKIMDKIDLVICNGGSGTLYQAYAYGKPVLAFPTNMDQLLACNSLKKKKLGKILRLKDLKKKKIKAAVVDLLYNPSYQRNLPEIMAEIKEITEKGQFKEYVEKITEKI